MCVCMCVCLKAGVLSPLNTCTQRGDKEAKLTQKTHWLVSEAEELAGGVVVCRWMLLQLGPLRQSHPGKRERSPPEGKREMDRSRSTGRFLMLQASIYDLTA